ncbi:MAG TPA: hypothetical protein VN881_09450 [Candidatus Acidoferrales bacterium]|nr:hypothetical protein [Candidatus Acidoferrales bacterium]
MPNIFKYVLVTSIYNEGDLAAKQLKGNCDISCSESIQNRSVLISRDFLGGSPYELEVQEFWGPNITRAINAHEVSINCDIQFSYTGLDEHTPENYTAKYQYDKKLGQMERVHS